MAHQALKSRLFRRATGDVAAFAACVSLAADIAAAVSATPSGGKLGIPPKIIRVKKCDFPSQVVADLLRREAMRIADLPGSERAVFDSSAGADLT